MFKGSARCSDHFVEVTMTPWRGKGSKGKRKRKETEGRERTGGTRKRKMRKVELTDIY